MPEASLQRARKTLDKRLMPLDTNHLFCFALLESLGLYWGGAGRGGCINFHPLGPYDSEAYGR